MSRMMMLVGAEGAMLAQTRTGGEGSEADQAAELQLREEAKMSGFSDEELVGAHVVVVDDFDA